MERTEKPEALPLISVIVPVYRVERFLNRCVESICAQTYRNLEIILVDDGSPDNCPAICDAWAERDERITVLHQENRGVSSARNAGMDAMKGAYWYSSGFFAIVLSRDSFVKQQRPPAQFSLWGR